MDKVLFVFVLLITFVVLVQSITSVVEVGYNNQLRFFPDKINVTTGDSVIFKFVSGTHNVIQSDDANSCEKSTDPNAFQSATNPPSREFTITINQTSGDIWYYCGISQHCTAGMKGVIRIINGSNGSNSTTSDAIRLSTSFVVIGLCALVSSFFF